MVSDSIVIVGGGHVAVALCAALVDAGRGRRIKLVRAVEVHSDQSRSLSKAFLNQTEESIQLNTEVSWFIAQEVSVHHGDGVVEINRDRKEVTLSSGRRLGYRHLVLATGSRATAHPKVAMPTDNVSVLRIRPSIWKGERCSLEVAILVSIRESGSLTTKEIASNTGHPLSQVSAAIRYLRTLGVVDIDPSSIRRRFILTAVGFDLIGEPGLSQGVPSADSFAFSEPLRTLVSAVPTATVLAPIQN